MAILQGQAARDYLAQNPQASYRALAPEELASMTPRKRGLIENIGLGLTKPFRGLAEQIASVGGFLVDPTKPIENRDLKFLTDEEEKIFRENPLLAGAQYGAGIGAFAVPGGKAFGGGFKGAVASGATSGTLGGFGAANREEDVLKSTAMGGGIGGAFGGALYGVGKGFEALKNARAGKTQIKNGIVTGSADDANRILESVTKEGPRTGRELLTGGDIAADNLDELRRTFDSLPEGDMTKNAMKSLYGFGDDAGALSDDILNRVPAKLQGTTDDVVSQFDNTLDDIMRNSPAEQKRQALEKLFKSIPDSEPLAPGLRKQVSDVLDELPLGTPKVQNTLEKWGRDTKYGGMGTKAQYGDLDYIGKVDLDKNAIDWSLDMAKKQGLIKNTSLTPANVSKIPNALGKIRTDALKDVSLRVTADDLIDDLSPMMAERLRIPASEARSVMTRELQNYITKGGGARLIKGMSPDDIMQGRFVLDENALHKLTQDWGKGAFKTQTLWESGSGKGITPDMEAKRLLNDFAEGTLKDASPVYANTNRAFHALYRQNRGFVNAANRGQISVTGGRAGIVQQIQPWAERQIGGLVEGLGHMQAKLPSAGSLNPAAVLNNPTYQKLVTVGGSTGIPQTINQGQYQGQGDVLGADTMQGMLDYMPSPGQSMGYPQGGSMGYSQGGSPQMMIQGNPGAQQMIAMQLLSSGMSPSDVKLTMELLGISGPAGGKDLTEGEKDYELAINAAENAYGTLMNQGGAGKLATIGGKIGDFFGAPSDSTTYRAQLELANGFIRKALLGSAQSDAELKKIEGLLPKPTDEKRVAQEKLEKLIPMLQSYGNLNMQ